mgnify:CR=1 FL=1
MLRNAAVAVAVFYREARLQYLETIARDSSVFIVTNTDDPEQQARVLTAVGRHDTTLIVPSWMGHP